MLKELIKLANSLDERNFRAEASELDRIIKKMAAGGKLAIESAVAEYMGDNGDALVLKVVFRHEYKKAESAEYQKTGEGLGSIYYLSLDGESWEKFDADTQDDGSKVIIKKIEDQTPREISVVMSPPVDAGAVSDRINVTIPEKPKAGEDDKPKTPGSWQTQDEIIKEVQTLVNSEPTGKWSDMEWSKLKAFLTEHEANIVDSDGSKVAVMDILKGGVKGRGAPGKPIAPDNTFVSWLKFLQDISAKPEGAAGGTPTGAEEATGTDATADTKPESNNNINENKAGEDTPTKAAPETTGKTIVRLEPINPNDPLGSLKTFREELSMVAPDEVLRYTENHPLALKAKTLLGKKRLTMFKGVNKMRLMKMIDDAIIALETGKGEKKGLFGRNRAEDGITNEAMDSEERIKKMAEMLSGEFSGLAKSVRR